MSNIPANLENYLELLEMIRLEKMPCLIDGMYTSEQVRNSYFKHMSFLKAGAKYRQRLFMAGNRVGKTEGAGGFELALHLTGRYPDWWGGRRFDKPIIAWCAGNTKETTRDILQKKIIGEKGKLHENKALVNCNFIKNTSMSYFNNLFNNVQIKHVSGGISTLFFKSYDQGREAFEGTEVDVILLDEEPPLDIYTECLIRTMTTNGIIMLTFTPLKGMSETILSFFPDSEFREGELDKSRHITLAGWDDAPHLLEEEKEEMLKALPPFQRLARSRGIPQLGAGVIYPVEQGRYVCEPFEIPNDWKKCFSMDVGWNVTGCLWGAYDERKDIYYIFLEHYGREMTPLENSYSIKSKGEWINGVIDPASQGRNQKDGTRLIDEYRKLGLKLLPADNTVEAGISKVWTLFTTGKLKIFEDCKELLRELRMYSRDEKGKIIKKDDHLCDCLRYIIMSGFDVANLEYQSSKNFQRQSRNMVI